MQEYNWITTVEIFHKWLEADKKWSDLLIKGLGGVVDKAGLEEAYAEFDKYRVMFWEQSKQKRTN